MGNIFKGIQLILDIKNWQSYILDRFKLTRKPYLIIELRNGIKYKIRSCTSDRMVISEVVQSKIYTPPEMTISPNFTVVDIGAHIGVFGIMAACCASVGKVYCFEPESDNFNLLQENIRLNRITNIVVFNKAVAERTGEREIHVIGNNTGGHSFFSYTASKQKLKIQTISFNDFIINEKIETVDFLKNRHRRRRI